MINYKEFEVLQSLLRLRGQVDDVAERVYHSPSFYAFKSLDEVSSLVAHLVRKGYIKDNKVTDIALEEIEPLRVKNAIILAAGGSDISAKSVYSMPKGLFVKNGESLIERQIRQLKEAGINDITVVIGYKQELYYFLMDKWGVNLVINPELKKNNIYSLYCAADRLSSTYICNCDNYFEENPFSQYEYNSYHATVYKDNASNELLVRTNDSGRILEVFSGAQAGECIYGHAYVDSQFSARFKKYLEAEISDFRVTSLFWEEFFARHVDNLDMYSRHYSLESVFEFDSIQEIQNVDGLFLGNVSGVINSKICEVLHCDEKEIHNIQILQKGLTNILFTFCVGENKYIFRYPGDSSSFFIYRKNEVRAQQLAAKSHVDNTFVYIDESGVKISKFVDNTENIQHKYYQDMNLMKTLASQIRKFHDSSRGMTDWREFDYNPLQQCERLMLEASKTKGNLFAIFEEEWKQIRELYAYVEKDGVQKVMCHNDINGDNCLLTKNSFDIIDWEFAGWNDPAYDFGRVIAAYDFDDHRIDEILEAYFGRPATEKERLHWIAYIAIHNWYYVGWALYKESINESSRDWMLFFYKQVKRVLAYVLPIYRKLN